MTTKEIAYQYRLSQWRALAKERTELGLSIRAYCAQKGFAENTYFYWQRRLRDAACAELTVQTQEAGTNLVPSGWTRLEPPSAQPSAAVSVEINGCVVNVTAETDADLLAKVCRTLKSL